jgi:hypothetical protein
LSRPRLLLVSRYLCRRSGSEHSALPPIGGKSARRERWRLLRVAPLSARTPKTITDPDKLIKSLQKVRKDRFASVEDENISGISSVGGPILDASGKVCAAISVSYSRHFAPLLRIRDVAEFGQTGRREYHRLAGTGGVIGSRTRGCYIGLRLTTVNKARARHASY